MSGGGSFWESVCSILSDYMQLDVPRDPLLLLLLDDSSLQLNAHQKRTLLAEYTYLKLNNINNNNYLKANQISRCNK